MRLSWSSWLLLPALCSLGCDGGGSDCGPTSEWPTCNHGPSTPTNNSGDDDGKGGDDEEDGDNPVVVPPKKDAGKTTGSSMDAGAQSPPTDSFTDDSGLLGGLFGGDGGDGAVDTGDAGDASPPAADSSVDAGPEQCTILSDGRDGGACFGVYCATPASDLALRSSAVGACTAPDDLALACDGELSRVVAKCAQTDILALGFGRSVALCAGRAPSLAKASEDCINCYVDEVLCAAENCLATCFGGSSADCTSCRREDCGEEFDRCSGLPAP